jgi:hypothetical protein
MSYDVEISTSVVVMQCQLAIGDKEEREESKTIYIALVTPESPSGGVTYRHGVAVVSLTGEVFDSLLSFLSPIANRHCITATDVEISTS